VEELLNYAFMEQSLKSLQEYYLLSPLVAAQETPRKRDRDTKRQIKKTVLRKNALNLSFTLR
jgi:hypothetical protein